MAPRFHGLLKIIIFDANSIWRQRYELSKQLQDLHIDVTLLSQIYLKVYEWFFIPNYHFYRNDPFPGRKDRTVVAVREDIPQIMQYSINATGVCIPFGNSEVLLAVVCTSSGHACNDTDINELLIFGHKSILVGDLNAKHPFWNCVVSSP
jgi:hypothetical protein